MKLLIIGFKDGVDDALIENGVLALQGIMGIEVNEVCGKESDSIAFRSSFYTLVLKGVIQRPILEVLSYGPKTSRDLEFLSKRKEMENIVEYARVALSMIS